MFLSRSWRVRAGAVDQALRSQGWFSLHTNRLRDVTVTLHKGHALQTHRAVCVSTVGVHAWTRQHQQDSHPFHNSSPSSAFIVTNWQHLDRVSTVAAALAQSGQSKGANSDISTRPLICASRAHGSRRTRPVGDVWFTGTCGLFTRTMQTRASSTAAAAAKRREVDEEQHADSNKEVEQNIKDASAISSSTAKAPGESEPEGGKPSKTQQLKKVFKEYGAVGVSFHIGISLMSLGMVYLLISSGIDMAAVLCKVGFSEAVVKSKMAAGTSTFVLAYAIHKLFAPVRMSITLMSVPLIVRYFRKTGLFKPPSAAP